MGFHSTPIAALLPHDPIGRRGKDGRVFRVIPLDRHLLPAPVIKYPTWSWKAACDPVDAFGHPEVLFTLHRIEALLSRPNRLSEAEIMRLRVTENALPAVFEPVREEIARRYPADRLLPCFGHWATFTEVLSGFRERGGRGEVYRAICWLNAITVWLDLLEARPMHVAANGDVQFDARRGQVDAL